MISATAILIGKIFLMMVIIGGMIMLLMGIGHLFHTDDLNTTEDDLKLRDEVENEEQVVGEKSVFYNFLVDRSPERDSKRETRDEDPQL